MRSSELTLLQVQDFLYSLLDRLQKNKIYCGTDSFIFIQPSGEVWPIDIGDKLGDMQSELNPSEFIVQFVSGGPKFTHTG